MSSTNLKRAIANAVALAFFISMSAGLTACGAADHSQGGTSALNNSQPSPTDILWQQVDTQGYVNGGPFGKAQIISLDRSTQTVKVTIPLPVNPFGVAIQNSPIPEIPGATVSLAPAPNGTTWNLVFTIPLQDLVKGVSFQNPTTLPSGSPLPQVPGGELPRIAAHFQINGFTFYVYGSIKYFAIYIPVAGFNPFVALSYPILNPSGTVIEGYISTVPQTTVSGTTYDGGFFVTMVFPASLQRLLDNLVN